MVRYVFGPAVSLMLSAATAVAQAPLIDPPLSPGQYLRLEGMPVITPAGARIGVVEDALIDRSGTVMAVAVDLDHIDEDGGEVMVMLKRFRLDDGVLVSTLTKDQLSAFPKWTH